MLVDPLKIAGGALLVALCDDGGIQIGFDGPEQAHGEQKRFPPAEAHQHAPFKEAADGIAGHQRSVARHHLGRGQTGSRPFPGF